MVNRTGHTWEIQEYKDTEFVIFLIKPNKGRRPAMRFPVIRDFPRSLNPNALLITLVVYIVKMQFPFPN